MPDLSILMKDNASCTELMECFFDLAPQECEGFYALASRDRVTLDELSAMIRRNRSTTHRLLNKLVGLGLCYKETNAIPRGGYLHLYSAISPARITQLLSVKMDEFMGNLNRILPTVETDIKRNIDRARNGSIAP